MGTASFRAGVRLAAGQSVYALLRKVDEHTWQLEDVRTRRIHEYTENDLRQQYCDGTLRFITANTERWEKDDSAGGIAYRDIPEHVFEKAKIRLQYVKAVLQSPSTQKVIAPVILAVWERNQTPAQAPSPATVLRWKAKYLASGRDIHALVERSDRKGNRAPRYPSQVIDLIQQALERTYLSRERKTLQDALDKAQVLVSQENRLLPRDQMLPMPTRRLVKRIIEMMPAMDRHTARYGRTSALKTFRAVHGHAAPAAPLQRAEIDHTLLDLFVVDDHTGLPLGRCWLTACIDVYTRCILGIYIGFQPPSFLAVAHCLKHAFLPKLDLAKQYPTLKNTWEAHGVMSELIVDNGTEFHGSGLDNLCFSLGIEIQYSPRKTPWFKGHIERFFGSLNQGIAHGNPGTTFSNIFEKDDYDPAKHAVVRLSALHQLVRLWIVDYYHQKKHGGLDTSPAALWHESIDPADIRIPDDLAVLDAVTGRSEQRILTHKGVLLHNLAYNSPELTAMRATLGDKLEVEVRVNDADLGHVTVFAPDKSRFYKVPALNPDYAVGMSLWQHKLFQRYAANRIPETSGLPSWLLAKEAICQLVENEFKWAKHGSRSKLARFEEHQRGLGTAPASEMLTQPKPRSQRAKPTVPPTDLLTPSANPTEASAPVERKKFAVQRRDRTAKFNTDDHVEEGP